MENWKTYIEITNLAAIARRYFVNNFYDGAITITGVLLGFLATLIKGDAINSNLIILAGLGTCISMFISGFSGSYLSEKAEQRKVEIEIKKAMGRYTEEENQEAPDEIDEVEIEKAMLKKIKKQRSFRRKRRKENEEVETLYTKAESLANKIVSLVNGGAPFLGGLIPLIPFFFVKEAGLPSFVISFIIIIFIIILLGVFLGKVSKESILKNVAQMVLAFIVTFLITMPILLFTPSV
jgi:predicted membrane protein (TIGR00267 family)